MALLLLLVACAPSLDDPDDVTALQAAAVAHLLESDGWNGTTTACVAARDLSFAELLPEPGACEPDEADSAALVAALQAMNYPVDASDACTSGGECLVDAETGERATRWSAGCPYEEDDAVLIRVSSYDCDLAAEGWLCTATATTGGWVIEECTMEWIS